MVILAFIVGTIHAYNTYHLLMVKNCHCMLARWIDIFLTTVSATLMIGTFSLSVGWLLVSMMVGMLVLLLLYPVAYKVDDLLPEA